MKQEGRCRPIPDMGERMRKEKRAIRSGEKGFPSNGLGRGKEGGKVQEKKGGKKGWNWYLLMRME